MAAVSVAASESNLCSMPSSLAPGYNRVCRMLRPTSRPFPGVMYTPQTHPFIRGLQPLLAIEASHPRRPFSNAPTTK
jgi:hypothetical protein